MGAKILSRDEIIDCVKSGKIEISYYCIIDNTGNPIRGINGTSHPVTHDASVATQSDAWRLFEDCLEEDSLRLTVGPYAMVENRTIFRWVWDVLFGRKFIRRNSQNIFSLFEKRELYLYQNENILIGTNECVSVDKTIGGSLFATVRNTDVGLPHISTTIDPGWSGRLQIGLVNSTGIRKSLSLSEPICKVRFHEYDNVCSGNTAQSKPHGLTWESIESDPTKDFFPRRKESVIKLAIVMDFFLEIITKVSSILLVIASLLMFVYSHYHEITENIGKLDKEIAVVREDIDVKGVKNQQTLIQEELKNKKITDEKGETDIKSIKERLAIVEKELESQKTAVQQNILPTVVQHKKAKKNKKIK